MNFQLDSKFNPSGDQPQAIEKLTDGIKKGAKFQTLLGVTGSGKTFTVANVISKIKKPTLVICHNKTLAAQLTQEFRTFFPKNAVEYFVSYYDYYQPEAYLPNTDIYIEKDVEINQEIERLRHAATQALLTRKDVIIVASVSCIYGLGSPEQYSQTFLYLEKNQVANYQNLIDKLISMYFVRSDFLERGRFRLHGQILDVMPADQDYILRVQFQNDQIKSIVIIDPTTRETLENLDQITVYPAKHFIVDRPLLESAISQIQKELQERLKYFEKKGKLLEAERLERRTKYDLEMLKEIGYCQGVENYSRYLTGRKAGQAPYTLLDYFPSVKRGKQGSAARSGAGSYFSKDFLTIIDESHVTVPQIGGMYFGDKSRKDALIEHGFRLPSAYDNRPLKFSEFERKIGQTIFTSATPANYEKEKSEQIVEQIIRPTGLVDPEIEIRPTENQVKNLIAEIEERAKKNERILVTALTKKMAEDLAEFLNEAKIKASYLHSEVETLNRVGILENLRRGEIDCLVGVNLLREGLDLPEVTLVAILDADKEGFLRSEVSLIQTIGRAARNVSGKVILYADNITGSMKRALFETNRRRKMQIEFNKIHNITPKTIEKNIETIIDHELRPEVTFEYRKIENLEDLPEVIYQKQNEMKIAAKNLEFEKAALIRDEIVQLKKIKMK